MVVVSAMGKTTDRLVEALDAAIAGRGPDARRVLARLREDTATAISDANPGDSGAAAAAVDAFFEALDAIAQGMAGL